MLGLLGEESHYALKELQDLANKYWQDLGHYLRDWGLRVLDQGGWNIMLCYREFIYMGKLFWDTGHPTMVLGCCYYSDRMTLRNLDKVIVYVK